MINQGGSMLLNENQYKALLLAKGSFHIRLILGVATYNNSDPNSYKRSFLKFKKLLESNGIFLL